MGSIDRVEDRTFKVNFTGDGAAKLRDTVNDKLKEFMGDYTDDTLVEYVIVLLRNGRRMEEARNELNVFLGDDSDSFVEWLWDHLSSNLDLYVQSQDSSGVIKTKSSVTNQASAKVEVESVKGNTENLPKSRNKREWKDLMRDAREPPPLRSSVVAVVDTEERSHHKETRGRSSSPDSPKHKKRNRQDERQHLKLLSQLKEAAAKTTAQAIFFISIVGRDTAKMFLYYKISGRIFLPFELWKFYLQPEGK